MRSKHILIVLSVIAALTAVAVVVSAGDPDNPPGPPETTSSYTLEHIYDRLSTGAAGAQITFTEPISGPTVGTGHTLDEIMAVAPQVDDVNGATASQVVSGTTYWGLTSGEWGLQTGAVTIGGNVTGGDGQLTFAIPDGFYTGSKTATAQDADLVAGNIRSGVTLFGVDGNPNVVNTASGDAAAGDILSGQVAWVGGGAVTGTMPNNGAVTITPTTTNVSIAAGYHDGNGYVISDTDLISVNIKSGVTLFGVDGTLTGGGTVTTTYIPKTGQTTCWDASGTPISCTDTGQDGELQKGVAWPTPRFITGTTGVVTDTLTGLIWLENADCAGGTVTWTLAISYSNALYDGCTDCFGTLGDCGLSDGSSAGDWRLPNVRELQSLIDYGEYNPALPDGPPFTGVRSYFYWSSTSLANNASVAWSVSLSGGNVGNGSKSNMYYVWPVRGGQ